MSPTKRAGAHEHSGRSHSSFGFLGNDGREYQGNSGKCCGRFGIREPPGNSYTLSSLYELIAKAKKEMGKGYLDIFSEAKMAYKIEGEIGS